MKRASITLMMLGLLLGGTSFAKGVIRIPGQTPVIKTPDTSPSEPDPEPDWETVCYPDGTCECVPKN